MLISIVLRRSIGMGLYINTPTDSLAVATKYAKNNVIISKRDLRRIKKLAKGHGFLAELLALNIDVSPLRITGE